MSVLTRDFKETIVARVERDPDFARALMDEAGMLIAEARYRSAVEVGICAADNGEFATEGDVRAAFAKFGVKGLTSLRLCQS